MFFFTVRTGHFTGKYLPESCHQTHQFQKFACFSPYSKGCKSKTHRYPWLVWLCGLNMGL